MNKCANCSNDAAYIYQPSESTSIPYCVRCLPSFLIPVMKAGHLTVAASKAKSVKEAMDLLPKASEATPEPEPSVEKAPAKKAVKKASAVEPDAK